MAVTFDLASGMRFGDAMGLREFSIAHRLAHSAIAAAIAARYGFAVPGFDVGDERVMEEWTLLMAGKVSSPTKGMRDWLTLHALVHEAEYAAVRLGNAYNLTDVNFGDAEQFNDWMFAHQQAHAAVGSALGVA